MEIVPFNGWDRNVRIVSGDTEMIVTLEVGPRIIRYGFIDGPNELKVYTKDSGKTGGDTYHSYGGHRLWIAPEEDPKTLHPDNNPVEYKEEGGWHVFTAPTEKWFVQKEMRIRPDAGGFEIEHRLYNRGVYDVELAPWAITVVEVGGVCLIPQEPFVAHADRVLPVRPLVLWGYTDMTDPRFRWGREMIRMSHDPNRGATKIGMHISQGYAAYANHGNLFIKQFDDMDELYADFGCNFETYAREDMLEVESLGGHQTVFPGLFATHFESWSLIRSVQVPDNDAACRDMLDRFVKDRVPHWKG